jgi:ATP-dependent Clp protease protease subunit
MHNTHQQTTRLQHDPQMPQPNAPETPTPTSTDPTDDGRRSLELFGPVDSSSAAQIMQRLLRFENDAPGVPIHLFIYSGGGCVVSGLVIIDTMRHLTSPVFTYATGYAASMAAVILAAGEPDHRYILPHSRVMIHQASGNVGGTMENLRATLAFQTELEADADRILAECTGRTTEEIRTASRIDNWMNAAKAREFGLVDHILEALPRNARTAALTPATLQVG